MTLCAAKLVLQPSAVARLRLRDPYSIHRIVMDLYDIKRDFDERHASTPSGIQWVDNGEHIFGREILLLSAMAPREIRLPDDIAFAWKELPDDFFDHQIYKFSTVINPCRIVNGKRFGLIREPDVLAWFSDKSEKGGFAVRSAIVSQNGYCTFRKNDKTLSFARAKISGYLEVRDARLFSRTVERGIGKGRAFGFGLLQLAVVQ